VESCRATVKAVDNEISKAITVEIGDGNADRFRAGDRVWRAIEIKVALPKEDCDARIAETRYRKAGRPSRLKSATAMNPASAGMLYVFGEVTNVPLLWPTRSRTALVS
jgi:hypothetical protein